MAVGARIMARIAPLSSGINRFQGAWMTGIARGAVGRQARRVASLAAVLGGGSGGSGFSGNGKGSNGGGGSGRGGPESGPSGGSSWGRTAALVLAGGALLCGEGAAWAAKKPAPEPVAPAPKPADELTVDKVADMAWSLVGPILTNLGFSGCVGAAAGIALKKVGQFVAVLVGLGFLFVQGLAYTGFITVNWSHVHGTVNSILDVNKDGKVDANDFKPLVSGGLAALSQGVPSVGGFLAGFVMAIRSF